MVTDEDGRTVVFNPLYIQSNTLVTNRKSENEVIIGQDSMALQSLQADSFELLGQFRNFVWRVLLYIFGRLLLSLDSPSHLPAIILDFALSLDKELFGQETYGVVPKRDLLPNLLDAVLRSTKPLGLR